VQRTVVGGAVNSIAGGKSGRRGVGRNVPVVVDVEEIAGQEGARLEVIEGTESVPERAAVTGSTCVNSLDRHVT